MVEMNKIHEFAVKYYDLYSNSQTTEREVLNDFAEQCFDFGFEMDCGNSFVEAYSMEAFNDCDALSQVIDGVNDIQILGSAIFSQWRYLTHWAYYSTLLGEKQRKWFTLAFAQLAKLTSSNTPNRALKKMQLFSQQSLFILPMNDTEVEQRLTITAHGDIWLSRYCFSDTDWKNELKVKERFSISQEQSKKILTAICRHFQNNYEYMHACDAGIWELKLTYHDGIIRKFSGSMLYANDEPLNKLSHLIRSEIGKDDLLLFDGDV